MALRCSFEVRAGIIPGQSMPEYMKQWHIPSNESDSALCEAIDNARKEAETYAMELQDACMQGRACNWTQLTFIWY